ncbi:SET domain-containing protein [Auricularia subglabra TFB-10046 SS5]|nr:SET domain-containing protein [Auricularia subglabra TFB-10046 SS5]
MDGAAHGSGPSLPGQAASLSPEFVAALEAEFQRMLVALSPSLYAPCLIKNAAQKPGASRKLSPSGAKIRAISASDIAFPSGNNVLDHSPNAPFNLNMHELQNPAVPSTIRINPDPPANSDDLLSRLKMRSVTTASGIWTAITNFGRPGGVSSFVYCDIPTRNLLRAHPLFDTQLCTEPHVSMMPFYIADIPGCGKGLFASRRIERGECILREPPLVVKPGEASVQSTLSFQQRLENMHPRALKAFDALYDCHRVTGAERLGILRTNGIALDIPGSSLMYGGVFELISRLNHSCAANVTFKWSFQDFQGSIWATEDIQAGQELTFCYFTNGERVPREFRRAELLRKYKFVCTCAKCGPA